MQNKTHGNAEDNFIALLNFIADPAVIVDEKGRFLVINDAFTDLTGLKKKELIGTAFADLGVLSAENKAILLKNLEKRIKGLHVEPYELSFSNQTGAIRYAEVKAKKITYSGHPADLVVFRDITRRKENVSRLKEYSEKMEALVNKKVKEIEESEIKYRTLVEQSLQGILIGHFSPFRFVFANQPMASILGYTVDELTSLSPEKIKGLIHPEDQSFTLENYRKGLLGKRVPQLFEFRMIKKNGNVCWVEMFCALTAYAGKPAVQAIFVDITERKQLENSLRTSEEMFRAISTSAMDAIILLDDTGKITYWNPAAERIFGYTNEEAVGKKLDNLVIPSHYQEPHSKSAMQTYETGQTHKRAIETKALRKNGTEVPIELSVAVLKIKDKKHLLGVIRDISERQKMETTLREAEKRYHALFDKAPLGILLVDQTGTAVEFNKEAHNQLGYSREEFAKLNVSDYEVLETPEETRARMKKILQEGKDEFETKHRTKNGEIRDVINTVQVIELAGKKFFHRITRDITEQKKIEHELEMERDKLEAVAKNIGAGLTIIGRDYRILWANELLKQLGNVENQLCYATYSNLDRVCPDCGVKKIFEDGVALDRHEYSFKDDKGKTQWVELIVTPIKDEKGNVTAALELSIFITEKKFLQKKLEEYSQQLEKLIEARTEELKQTQAKLVKSERLATIGELAAMVGHDLRNPLTGIVGAAYYLKTKYGTELGAKGKEMLETIEKAIDYSNKIVNDLLEYSRDLKLDFAEVTPKALLKNALSLLEVPEKIQVVDATENKPTIKADKEKMRRVIVNIVKNAFDAMPEGGTLTIKSRAVKGKLELTFKDTGTGMSEETLSKLEGEVPLFTTKAKGMGLGLAICRRVAEAHGGKISVTSTAGKGTKVTVAIPVKPKRVNEGKGFLFFSEAVSSAITVTQRTHNR